MSTHIKAILTGFMVLILLCAPCMAACPYANSDNTAKESTNSGSTCPNATPSCSGNSCSSCTATTPDTYGAFKCESGNCTTKVCENGDCETSTLASTSAGNATGAAVCKDGTCKTKVCEDGACETGTTSLSGNSLKSFFASLLGGTDTPAAEVTTPVSTCESSVPTTSVEKITVAPAVKAPTAPVSKTNFYGSFASASGSEAAPVAVEDSTPVETPTCESASKCGAGTGCTVGKTCESTAEPASTCESGNQNVTPVEGVAAYSAVYSALKADKTEKNSLSASYTSLNFAQDICAKMTKQEIDCQVVKVTFTDGKVNYFNSFQTDQGELRVDSCGTANGSGIKKIINTLEVGKQWKATSLFKQCPLPYDRGTVSTIEYLK